MPWRVVVRIGPRVVRSTHEDVEDALTEVAAACRTAPPRNPVDLRYKRYAPGDLVAVRAEMSGPTRVLASVRAGVDVRGDGSAQAWTGRLRRRPVEAEPGEDAIAALRRTVGDGPRA